MNAAWRVGACSGQFGRLEGATRSTGQIDRDHIIKMTCQELELTAEIAWRGLRGCRVVGILFEFFVEFVDRDTDLVQVAMLSELDPARHHVNV